MFYQVRCFCGKEQKPVGIASSPSAKLSLDNYEPNNAFSCKHFVERPWCKAQRIFCSNSQNLSCNFELRRRFIAEKWNASGFFSRVDLERCENTGSVTCLMWRYLSVFLLRLIACEFIGRASNFFGLRIFDYLIFQNPR